MRHERLAVVLADVTVGGDAGLAPQVAVELSRVVVFDDEGLPRPRKRLGDGLGVERQDPLDGEPVDLHAVGLELFHRLRDDAGRGTPTHQRDLRVLVPFDFGSGDPREVVVQLAGALFDHLAALDRVRELVRDEDAFLVVLVGGDHVDMAGHSGHGSGRDAVGGIEIPVVGSRVPVRFADQLSALDGRRHVDVVGRHAEGALGDEQIRENDGRALVAVDQVEDLGDGAESVVGVLRGHHDPFEIALAGSERLPEVTLFGLGGHSGRGPGAHHVDEHHRESPSWRPTRWPRS